ncbi:MAG TPA: TIGR03089 family protein, partial [Marmoricola sp.]|nr:TIGR03089 family protein [Marmoricola sp.]
MERSYTTFPQLVREALRRDPGRPFITAYDEASGWRTELSVTTFANWVNKTANLLVDEYLLGEGDTIRIDLAPHWLAPVFLGAAWTAGVAVTTEPGVAAHLVVAGPTFDEHLLDTDLPVVATSLDAFAGRFAQPLPEGIDDYGALWPGQPDVFVPSPPPGDMTVAWRHPEDSESHEELVQRARDEVQGRRGTRLLTAVHPLHDSGVPTLLAALVSGG